MKGGASMKWQELKELWQKEKTYTKNLIFICHMRKRKQSKESIAAFYDLDNAKELEKFAEGDKMFKYALAGENVVGHADYHDQAYKYYKGFEYQEPYDENYVDSDGKQKKRLSYRTKVYVPSFKDREYYGKKFIDPAYADQVEEFGLKTELKESGKVTCLKPTRKKTN